jgi:hypothetical protein
MFLYTIFCFKLVIYIIYFESYVSIVIDYIYKNYLNFDFVQVSDILYLFLYLYRVNSM